MSKQGDDPAIGLYNKLGAQEDVLHFEIEPLHSAAQVQRQLTEIRNSPNVMTFRVAASSCGQLSVRTQGEPTRVSVCHRLACQRRTGSVFAAQARFPLPCVTITGTSSTWARIGDEGSKAICHFCPTCGATVYFAVDGYGTDSIAIPVGAFADPAFPTPKVSVYEERMHGWVLLPEDIEHML